MVHLGCAGATPLCELAGKGSNKDQKKTPWDVGSADMDKEQKSTFQIRIMYIKREEVATQVLTALAYFTSVLISNPKNTFRHGCHAHFRDNETEVQRA